VLNSTLYLTKVWADQCVNDRRVASKIQLNQFYTKHIHTDDNPQDLLPGGSLKHRVLQGMLLVTFRSAISSSAIILFNLDVAVLPYQYIDKALPFATSFATALR